MLTVCHFPARKPWAAVSTAPDHVLRPTNSGEASTPRA